LQNYEECIGFLKKLEINDYEVAVILSCNDFRVIFPAGSREAEILIQELNNEPPGQKIAILRIDHPQHPIMIRRLPR
jgi:hypothetical protein